jgi:hypothetical protein
VTSGLDAVAATPAPASDAKLLDNMLDPSKKSKSSQSVAKLRAQVKEIFKALNMTAAYSSLFEVIV